MRTSDSSQSLLRWLQTTIVNSVRQRHDDLTMRQLAVMLVTYLDSDVQTVRGLAKSLRISRPAVSRALDRLGEAGLTRRQVDRRDRRSIVVRRTRKGSERMQYLRNLMIDPAAMPEYALEEAAPTYQNNVGSLPAGRHPANVGRPVSNGRNGRL